MPSDHYHVDLSRMRLSDFADSLRSRTMIPSRRVLKDDLENRFAQLTALGIESMAGLLAALKSKDALDRVAVDTGLPVDYLTVLKREVKSYLPNPVSLGKFAGIDPRFIQALANLGIGNSRQLFRVAAQRQARKDLANETGVPVDSLDELVCLCHLSRLYGVGPVFARLLYDAGFQTVESMLGCTAEDLVRLYEERTGKAADFGVHEIQVTLELAQRLDTVLEI